LFIVKVLDVRSLQNKSGIITSCNFQVFHISSETDLDTELAKSKETSNDTTTSPKTKDAQSKETTRGRGFYWYSDRYRNWYGDRHWSRRLHRYRHKSWNRNRHGDRNWYGDRHWYGDWNRHRYGDRSETIGVWQSFRIG
jgi:hypothetical protein